ncbi:MAG TPA: PTS sugar transporter subunit IIA [Sedimentisphaerales bacterium]|nr:PTS sugar transporter subunit IIA [Sedimentisphaerales bacterium]
MNMILARALSPSCVKVPLEATDKNGIITELVDSLHENGFLPDRDKTLGEIFDREHIRSTGVGRGIAIPHGRSASVHDLVLAVGVPRAPVEFDSVDGNPVSIVVLLVSPARQTGAHIQAMATISRMMLDLEFREALERASSAQAVYELFAAGENPGVGHGQRQMAVA